MSPRREKEWREEPRPGELLYHLKWSHGVWVSNKETSDKLDAIHRELHGPPPDGWLNNGTWEADHSHQFPPVQEILPIGENEGNWTW